MDAVRHVPVSIGDGRVQHTTAVRTSEAQFTEDVPLTINLLRELDRAVHMPWIGERFDRTSSPRYARYACFGVWAVVRGDVFDAHVAALLTACTDPAVRSVRVSACAGIAVDAPLGLYLLTRFVTGRPPCASDSPGSLLQLLAALRSVADAGNTWLASQYFGAAVHLALVQSHTPWAEVTKHIGWAADCPFADDAKRTRNACVHFWNWLWTLVVVAKEEGASTQRLIPAQLFLQLYALFQQLFEAPVPQTSLVHAQTLVWFGLLAAWLGQSVVMNDDVDGAETRDAAAATAMPQLPAPALCGWLRSPGRAVREFITAAYSMWEVTGANTAASSASRLLIEEQMQLPNLVVARCAAVFAPALRAPAEMPQHAASIAAIRF
jgi:hypothetical protein